MCVFCIFPLSYGWEWVDGLRLTARPLGFCPASLTIWPEMDKYIHTERDREIEKNNNHVGFNLHQTPHTWTEHHKPFHVSFFFFFDSLFFFNAFHPLFGILFPFTRLGGLSPTLHSR